MKLIPIHASDMTVLIAQLASVDISVPGRIEGRTSGNTEAWTLCRLLATLANAGELRFPLSAAGRERPDFLLELAGRLIGIEVTEAITAEFAAFCALAEREFPGVWFSLAQFRMGGKCKTPEDMRAVLRGDVSMGDGWVGDSPEREWASYIADAVSKKGRNLVKVGFETFDENWLSMYDNLPVPNIHLGDAIKLLRPLLEEHWDSTPSFDRVFIEHGQVIACVSRHEASQLELNDLWQPSGQVDAEQVPFLP